MRTRGRPMTEAPITNGRSTAGEATAHRRGRLRSPRGRAASGPATIEQSMCPSPPRDQEGRRKQQAAPRLAEVAVDAHPKPRGTGRAPSMRPTVAPCPVPSAASLAFHQCSLSPVTRACPSALGVRCPAPSMGGAALGVPASIGCAKVSEALRHPTTDCAPHPPLRLERAQLYARKLR
jgi:hypothetical protein